MARMRLRFRLSVSLIVFVLIAGCGTSRKPAAPPPSYPAVSPSSVRILDRQPSPPYEIVGTITEQTNAEVKQDRTIAEIRQRAGNSGANAIVIISEKLFTWRNDTIHRRLRTRRIVVRALRLP